MHGRPITQSLGQDHAGHPKRWHILGVLVLALLVTSIDHTIINVAMPRLVGDLGGEGLLLFATSSRWLPDRADATHLR